MGSYKLTTRNFPSVLVSRETVCLHGEGVLVALQLTGWVALGWSLSLSVSHSPPGEVGSMTLTRS